MHHPSTSSATAPAVRRHGIEGSPVPDPATGGAAESRGGALNAVRALSNAATGAVDAVHDALDTPPLSSREPLNKPANAFFASFGSITYSCLTGRLGACSDLP